MEKQLSQSEAAPGTRRLPVGAEIVPGGVHFRVWAPASAEAAIEIEGGKAHPLAAEGNGYFSGLIAAAKAGTRYKVKLASGSFPDPASRFQPEGPHGPSQVVDPGTFQWTDSAWPGAGRDGQVIYEMHIGTFTPDGTWRAAMEELPALRDLGITILEVMPVAEFPGLFGWGYDGVDLFAPTRLYGSPDEFRAFVDRAHSLGLAVILDVVYNHFGPDACYLREFSKDYFTQKYDNEWGDALNFDGENSAPVREFFIANAGYWIREYHLDGLRLDATQQIYDDSEEHILLLISRAVREAGGKRATYIVNENEPQHIHLVQPEDKGGFGMDSLWNDDLHHSAVVALTGRNEAYFSDHRGTPQEFVSSLKYGYLYQGQYYSWQKKRRGTPSLNIHPAHFVSFLQNHDQVANSLLGHRIHLLTSGGCLRAMTAVMLLGPQTPMLFQGQEFAASAPFLYFADHKPELAKLVSKGRCSFLRQFPSIDCLDEELDQLLAEPASEATFRRCKLDHTERETNPHIYALHRDLLELRRKDPVFSRPRLRGVDGAVLGTEAFVIRFFHETDEFQDRLLVVNLGVDRHLDPAPEPLLAPPAFRVWRTLWSSEHPKYGGHGSPLLDSEENWLLPGRCAVVLHAVPPPPPKPKSEPEKK